MIPGRHLLVMQGILYHPFRVEGGEHRRPLVIGEMLRCPHHLGADVTTQILHLAVGGLTQTLHLVADARIPSLYHAVSATRHPLVVKHHLHEDDTMTHCRDDLSQPSDAHPRQFVLVLLPAHLRAEPARQSDRRLEGFDRIRRLSPRPREVVPDCHPQSKITVECDHRLSQTLVRQARERDILQTPLGLLQLGSQGIQTNRTPRRLVAG